jgi:hypothetical protein
MGRQQYNNLRNVALALGLAGTGVNRTMSNRGQRKSKSRRGRQSKPKPHPFLHPVKRKPISGPKVSTSEQQGDAIGLHELANTHFRLKRHTKLEEYIKIAPPQYYQNLANQCLTGAQGSQYYYTLPTTMMDAAMQNTLNQSGAFSAVAESRLFVEHINQIAEITNFGNTVCEVWLYDVVAIKDCPPAGFDPVALVQAGYNAKYNNTAAYIRPFNTPQESTPFREYWKIEKTQHVTIKVGEVHKHTKYVEYDRIWDSQELSSGGPGAGGASPGYVAGWSRLTMVRAIGVCEPLTGFGTASIAKVEHAMVQTTAVKWRQPQGPANNQMIGTVNSTLDSVTQLQQKLAETGAAVNVN